MNQSQLVILTLFIAIFVQLWFVSLLQKIFITMLRTRYENTYNSPTLSIQHLMERSNLLNEYLSVLKKFFKRILIISFMINAAIVASILMYLER